MERIMVATDRSQTADRAVAWAADMASRYGAELVLLQVVADSADGAVESSLAEHAREIAGERGRARVRVGGDPAQAIVDAAEEERADLLVVGNVGMGGRREFLLGNVPNRVSHLARCSVVIVNTDLGVRPERAADGEPEVEGRLLGRAAQIGRVFAKHGFEERRDARRGGSMAVRAQRLRAALDELGPTFAKLGQILSTRPDLIPPEFVDELSTLQDRVTPLTEEEVVAVMERELGVPWEDVFATIDSEPLAAGTIGQVHRATLENGDRVVVKVQRPNARDEIMRDLGLLEVFARRAEGRAALRDVVDIPALADHLSASLRRELDFLQEAGNIERMAEVLAPYDRLGVPTLYQELSTPRLLVMGEIVGIPIREAPQGEERKQAARQLLEGYYRQILQEGFFHADPHPGNLIWSDGKVFFIDFGMVGEIEPGVRELMLLMLLAFWRRDAKFLSDVVLMLSGEEQRSDLDVRALEADVAGFVDRFLPASLQEIQLGPMLDALVEIATRHGVRLPASLALSGKAFGQMQLAVTELDPELDPFAVISGFLLRGLSGRLREHANPQRMYYDAQKLKLRVGRMFEAIERAIGARPGRKLQIEFIGASPIEQAIRRAGRRLALAMTAAATFIAVGLTAASSHASGWIPSVLGAVAGVFAVALAYDLVRRR